MGFDGRKVGALEGSGQRRGYPTQVLIDALWWLLPGGQTWETRAGALELGDEGRGCTEVRNRWSCAHLGAVSASCQVTLKPPPPAVFCSA